MGEQMTELNTLSNNKSLDQFKLKASADNKMKVTKKLTLLWEG